MANQYGPGGSRYDLPFDLGGVGAEDILAAFASLPNITATPGINPVEFVLNKLENGQTNGDMNGESFNGFVKNLPGKNNLQNMTDSGIPVDAAVEILMADNQAREEIRKNTERNESPDERARQVARTLTKNFPELNIQEFESFLEMNPSEKSVIEGVFSDTGVSRSAVEKNLAFNRSQSDMEAMQQVYPTMNGGMNGGGAPQGPLASPVSSPGTPAIFPGSGTDVGDFPVPTRTPTPPPYSPKATEEFFAITGGSTTDITGGPTPIEAVTHPLATTAPPLPEGVPVSRQMEIVNEYRDGTMTLGEAQAALADVFIGEIGSRQGKSKREADAMERASVFISAQVPELVTQTRGTGIPPDVQVEAIEADMGDVYGTEEAGVLPYGSELHGILNKWNSLALETSNPKDLAGYAEEAVGEIRDAGQMGNLSAIAEKFPILLDPMGTLPRNRQFEIISRENLGPYIDTPAGQEAMKNAFLPVYGRFFLQNFSKHSLGRPKDIPTARWAPYVREGYLKSPKTFYDNKAFDEGWEKLVELSGKPGSSDEISDEDQWAAVMARGGITGKGVFGKYDLQAVYNAREAFKRERDLTLPMNQIGVAAFFDKNMGGRWAVDKAPSKISPGLPPALTP